MAVGKARSRVSLNTHYATDENYSDQSYLAYLRPTPRPFFRFASGHFPPGTVTPWHAHPCWALHGCLQGPLVMSTAEGPLDLDAGVFYLIAPLVRHYWRNPGRQTGAAISLLIDADDPGHWPVGSGVAECCRYLRKMSTSLHRFSVTGDRELQQTFWQAADYLTSELPCETIATTGVLLSLMGQIRSRLEPRPKAANAPADAAQRIRRMLLARVNDRLGINEVARELSMSASKAKQVFHEAFGCGIIAYHNQLKIWQAKRLLCDLSMTVEQISGKLGFSSPSYFSRVYLQHTGESPTDFRRREAGQST